MKLIFLILIVSTQMFAFINKLNSFEANFTQTITDDKNKVLTYSGKLLALKPQNALWKYTTPVEKDIYISKYTVTIIEPEIEQAIIRKITSNFDFFNIIKNAKQIDKNNFVAKFENTNFNIEIKNNLIESITYIDQFENKVKILFSNQLQNKTIDKNIFIPTIPFDFDIIRD